MSNSTTEAPNVHDLRCAKFREEMHGHGANGMYVYRYRCEMFPRLSVEIRRESRKVSEVRRMFVDGRDVSPDNDQAQVLAALNSPHDIAGCAGRLEERLVMSDRVVLEDGKLIVTGETPERCARLAKSFPSFEGVPIEWRSS